MRFFVYGLIDPRTHEIRYIGKSSTGLRRPAQHRLPGVLRRDASYKGNWLRQLAASGLTYEVVVLEATTQTDLAVVECFWISQGRGLGWRLTNLTGGGKGGQLGRPAWNRGLKLPPSWNKGRKMPREEWLGRGFDRTGRPHTAATRTKMRERQRGNRNAAKLDDAQVRRIRTLLLDGRSQREVARLVGINQAQVSRIKTGKAHAGAT